MSIFILHKVKVYMQEQRLTVLSN